MSIEHYEGMWLIEGDRWISKWAKETRRLDHDQWLMSRLKERWDGSGLSLDIGAYIGDHTVFYAKSFDRVVAYEPNPEPFECLLRNCGGFSNVTCIQAAVGQPKEVGYTLALTQQGNPGTATLVESDRDTVVFIVPQIQQKVDFIKIDVEGAELDVLMALEPIIERDHPQMLIEQRAQDGNEKLVQAFLVKFGYSFEPIQGEWGEQYDLWCE